MRNLTNNPAFDAWPRWSPDGKQIVFGSNRENKTDYEIYVMNADGNSVQRLTELHSRNTSPKWSPDEKKISFDHAAQGERYLHGRDTAEVGHSSSGSKWTFRFPSFVMSTEVETSLNILLHSKVRDPSTSPGMTKENAYARVQEYKYSS